MTPEVLPEIVQIIPAQGHVAVYRSAGGQPFTGAVVLWALVRHTDRGDTWNDVEGLETGEGGIVRCEEADNFQGYVDEASYDAADWSEA